MIVIRFLLLLPLLLSAHLSIAAEAEDFKQALIDLRLGERYTPHDYLHCIGPANPCSRLEGAIGKVRVEAMVNEGRIAAFHVLAEDVRIERELVATLEALYGSGEKKREWFREESPRPDQALRIAAAGSVSYEWLGTGKRIILFGQDPFRILYDDGKVEITEPMKTYVSGDLSPSADLPR